MLIHTKGRVEPKGEKVSLVFCLRDPSLQALAEVSNGRRRSSYDMEVIPTSIPRSYSAHMALKPTLSTVCDEETEITDSIKKGLVFIHGFITQSFLQHRVKVLSKKSGRGYGFEEKVGI